MGPDWQKIPLKERTDYSKKIDNAAGAYAEMRSQQRSRQGCIGILTMIGLAVLFVLFGNSCIWHR